MTLAAVSRYRRGRVPLLGDHAVVVGGSVAGLLAARVLADGFESVTVLERDEYPDRVQPRSGVPQGGHIHALQEAGRSTFEDLFPGYGEDLLSAGGLVIDGASDLQFYDEGGFLADGPSRMPFYSASRPLYEHVIRRRLVANGTVSIRPSCQVREFRVDDGEATVEGVAFSDENDATRELSADLVVDATGRASRTPTWLEHNGYASPRVDEVEIDTAYSTIALEREPGDRRAILAMASGSRTRGCAAFPVEDDTWLVNIHGVHGDHPPKQWEGFEGFAETMPIPQVAALIAEYPRVWDEVDYYVFPSSRRHYYEDLDRFPAGLVVVGDALASFNPIYGQGMSVAALEALELHHALAAGGLSNLAARFFDRAADVVDGAWSMAVGADHQFEGTTGPKPRGSDLFSRYFARVVRKAQDDGRVREDLMRVLGMERPPTSLFRPGVAARVLRPSVPVPSTGRGSEEADPTSG